MLCWADVAFLLSFKAADTSFFSFSITSFSGSTIESYSMLSSIYCCFFFSFSLFFYSFFAYFSASFSFLAFIFAFFLSFFSFFSCSFFS